MRISERHLQKSDVLLISLDSRYLPPRYTIWFVTKYHMVAGRIPYGCWSQDIYLLFSGKEKRKETGKGRFLIEESAFSR